MFPSGTELDLAILLSASIECILYGISLVLFGGTVWALTHGRSKDEINWPMVLVAFILSILSTMHVVVDIRRLVVGFITKHSRGPPGFFADVTQRTFIIKNAIYILQTLLGDGVVIYRCYVVWQGCGVILLPTVLWFATCASSAELLHVMSHATDPDVFMANVGKRAAIFYALTMTTNLVGSGLLAYRIWITDRDTPGLIRVPPRSGVGGALLLRVLIDAAALYTLTLFTLLICYAFHNIGEFIVLDMVTPIISIAFYTVLVRIAIAKNGASRTPSTVLSPLQFSARVLPSPSESTSDSMFVITRRSSI